MTTLAELEANKKALIERRKTVLRRLRDANAELDEVTEKLLAADMELRAAKKAEDE